MNADRHSPWLSASLGEVFLPGQIFVFGGFELRANSLGHLELSEFWERGSPDLPACGPRHGSTSGPVPLVSTNKCSRPSRGAKPREADDTKTSPGAASLGWLPRSGDIYATGISRGSRDVSHDDQGQAGASECRPAQCPCYLFGAKGASTGVEYRGIRQRLPFRWNETKTSGRQDGGHRGAQDGVIASAFGSRRPTLVRITCTSCLPSNLAIVGSLPS